MYAESARPTIANIQEAVVQHYHLTKRDMIANRRARRVVMPRQIAMYLAKQLTLRSLPEIGKLFGGRDHTTVLHAVRKIEKAVSENASFAAEIETLQKRIDEITSGKRVIDVDTIPADEMDELAARIAAKLADRVVGALLAESDKFDVIKVKKLLAAIDRLDNDQYSTGEKGAVAAVIRAGREVRPV